MCIFFNIFLFCYEMERGEKPGWKKRCYGSSPRYQVDDDASPRRGKPQVPFIGMVFSGGNRFRTMMRLIKVSVQPETYTVAVVALEGSW
jgi:hypothetical protein